ncbi:MAG: divergent polysaccharide deacetylase family protein, partial [Rhizobiaceae bacterium]
MRNDPQLERIASSEPPSSTAIAPKTPADDAVSPENANPNGMPRSNPNSGATIEQNRMADGSVVTKYTPRARDGNGPVLINAQRIGQDPRFAAEPNTSLLEDTETLGLAASGNSLQRWMQEARRAGHEILIQVPFEPYDYPANDPGPGTLLVKDPASKNLERLHVAMGEITNYTGIMNYQGGRYLSDVKALEPVLRDMASRGLLFL